MATLNLYVVAYWSSIEWGRISFECLAESEEQVREMVEKECQRQFRSRPYSNVDEDSLIIDCRGPVTLPFRPAYRDSF